LYVTYSNISHPMLKTRYQCTEGRCRESFLHARQ
jgi:hypothetical protein